MAGQIIAYPQPDPDGSSLLADFICIEHVETDRTRTLLAAAGAGNREAVQEIYHWAKSHEQRFASLTTLAGEFLNQLGAGR